MQFKLPAILLSLLSLASAVPLDARQARLGQWSLSAIQGNNSAFLKNDPKSTDNSVFHFTLTDTIQGGFVECVVFYTHETLSGNKGLFPCDDVATQFSINPDFTVISLQRTYVHIDGAPTLVGSHSISIHYTSQTDPSVFTADAITVDQNLPPPPPAQVVPGQWTLSAINGDNSAYLKGDNTKNSFIHFTLTDSVQDGFVDCNGFYTPETLKHSFGYLPCADPAVGFAISPDFTVISVQRTYLHKAGSPTFVGANFIHLNYKSQTDPAEFTADAVIIKQDVAA